MSLRAKTLFISGASRGIGLAIALRAARDGANICVAAKTMEPHPKLPGTVYTAAQEIETAGGRALPVVCDIRSEEQVQAAVARCVEAFGGIDVCVNNASAIALTGTLDTEMKRFDLMHAINTRGTFMVSRACIPHLSKSSNPHVLNISPPLDLQPKWFGAHVAYTIAKFGMSLCVLGMSEEFRGAGIAFNALWPRTTIATAAIANVVGGKAALAHCRHPAIMADAAHLMLCKPAKEFTGQFCIDETLLAEHGVTDFSHYAVEPGKRLMADLFVDDEELLHTRPAE